MNNPEKESPQVVLELLKTTTPAECLDLAAVANVVKHHRGAGIPLVKPKGYEMRVCGQDATVYAGNEEQLEAWKDYYLPERMEMEVIGAVDEFPCEAFGLQLVLLLCEDGNVYAYEDEELHLVARSLKELFETGMTFPGLRTYKLGECFEDFTQEEIDEMMETAEMKEYVEAHDKFCESLENEMLEALMNLRSQMKTESDLEHDSEDERLNEDEAVQSIKSLNTTYISECKDIVPRSPMTVVPVHFFHLPSSQYSCCMTCSG